MFLMRWFLAVLAASASRTVNCFEPIRFRADIMDLQANPANVDSQNGKEQNHGFSQGTEMGTIGNVGVQPGNRQPLMKDAAIPSKGVFENPVNMELQDGDMKLLKDMVPDAPQDDDEDELSAENQDVLNQAINRDFASIVSNLAQNPEGEFYSKMDVIKRAMESAFLKAAGYVDHAYIDGALDMIRGEVKQHRALTKDTPPSPH